MDLDTISAALSNEIKDLDLLSNDSLLEEISKLNQTEENHETHSSESLEKTEEEDQKSDNLMNTLRYGKEKKDEQEKFVIRYFTPREVAEHNTYDDLWVSWLGNVYDLTSLSLEHRGDILLNPIIKNAGKDISHWFDKNTKNIRMHMNPKLGCMCPYTPDGRFIHIPPPAPYANWKPTVETPWWEDSKYCIGKLSKKTRKIRIVNTLTKDEHIIEVCSEESLNAIQDRYLKLNAHSKGYIWKRLGNLLDMEKTLEENNVKDESQEFEMLGMDEEEYLPVIHIYFSDDLSIA